MPEDIENCRQFALRTKGEEVLIQELPLEGMVFEQEVKRFQRNISYANRVARVMLGMIHEVAQKNLIQGIRDLANRKLLLDYIADKYAVDSELWEYTVRLIQRTGRARYLRYLQAKKPEA